MQWRKRMRPFESFPTAAMEWVRSLVDQRIFPVELMRR